MNVSQEGFSKIYDEYVEKIYRFIFLKVNSREICDDLTSETFTRFWDNFKENGDKIENVPAFLYRIARNLTTDYYRQKGKIQIVSADSMPIIDDRTNLEEEIHNSSDLEMVKSALSNLKEDYQEVIIWHYLDDLTIPEIAKMTDKSQGAIRVMLYRALGELRGQFEKV